MRLVRVRGGTTGVIVDAADGLPAVLELDESITAYADRDAAATGLLLRHFGTRDASWVPAIEAWDVVGPALRGLMRFAEGSRSLPTSPLAEALLDAPLPDPGVRIYALGGNFASHTAGTATAMALSDSVRLGTKDDTPPWGFYVIPGTVIGPDAVVTPPPNTRALDYEAEVGVVLAAGGYRPGQAEFPIWGYTAWNDLSIRDAAFGMSKTDHGPLTWSLTKNFQTGNACGPCMVVDEVGTYDQLRIVCRVNGEVRQDDSTAGMKYSFRDTADHIVEYLPMSAGDMILSGTPAGTAMEGGPTGPFLRDGDIVEVDVTGVGTLRNRVKLAD